VNVYIHIVLHTIDYTNVPFHLDSVCFVGLVCVGSAKFFFFPLPARLIGPGSLIFYNNIIK
jgi:hypothetical protein